MNLARVTRYISLVPIFLLVCLIAIINPVSGVASRESLECQTTKVQALMVMPYPQYTLLLANPQDTFPPRIDYFVPKQGSTVYAASLTIGARYNDKDSGIDELSARIQLDGKDVTEYATVTSSRIFYAATALTDGIHWVAVTVRDNSGNEAHQVWSFKVVAGSQERAEVTPPSTTSKLPKGTTDVSNIITSDGIFTEKTTILSEDGKFVLTISKDTQGLSTYGDAVGRITMLKMDAPPAPLEDSNIITIITPVYELGPGGTTFDPPILLTFTYDESRVPVGIAEENLIIAVWDKVARSWSELESVVDPETNTITAVVNYFAAFTVLAHARPANFIVSNLSITPRDADIGENVVISVSVSNTGDLSGIYEASLKIDNVTTETREVTVDGSGNKQLSFNIHKDTAGTYTVSIGGMSETFRVRKPAPPAFTISDISISPNEVYIGESVTISVSVTNTGDLTGTYEISLKIDNDRTVYTEWVPIAGGTNRIITFTKTPRTAGHYTVDVNGLTSSFAVRETASPHSPARQPISWSSLGILILILALGLIGFFLITRKSK